MGRGFGRGGGSCTLPVFPTHFRTAVIDVNMIDPESLNSSGLSWLLQELRETLSEDTMVRKLCAIQRKIL